MTKLAVHYCVFKIFILTAIICICLEKVEGDFICPPTETIAPCVCELASNSSKADLICDDPQVTQQTINNLFATVRSTNNLSDPDQWLHLSGFLLFRNDMTSLDLTPFAKTDFGYRFVIDQLPSLVTIVGPTNSSEEVDIQPYRFRAQFTEIESNDMTDQALGQILKFIDPNVMREMELKRNKFQGSLGDGEFFPNLAGFRKLDRLDLASNQVKRVAGGQFRTNNVMTELTLEDNLIEELGQDAFLFDPIQEDQQGSNLTLHIWLMVNNLTDDRIHPGHGLASSGRPTEVRLEYNYFEFISAANFHSFLVAHPGNKLYIAGNPTVCDERMQWLRDEREYFQSRVLSAQCTNDPGYDIFTTNLLP